MKLTTKQLQALIKEEMGTLGDRDPDPYREELNDITKNLQSVLVLLNGFMDTSPMAVGSEHVVDSAIGHIHDALADLDSIG